MIKGIILVGAPCSGKSEVGKMAAQMLSAKYISSGDIAREIAKTDKTTDENLASGKMAQEDLMRAEISKVIDESMLTNDIIILDGFPRFRDQADWLHNNFPGIDFKYAMVNVPLSQIIDRMHARGRSGDTKERISYYYSVTFMELAELIDIEINNDNAHTSHGSAEKLSYYMKGVVQCYQLQK